MGNKLAVNRLTQLKLSKYFNKKNKAIKNLLYGKNGYFYDILVFSTVN
jgi:hypothetical protein